MHPGEKFMMVLASTLNLDGTPDSGYFSPGNRKSLADKFDYVMQGKLYRISEESRDKEVKARRILGDRMLEVGGGFYGDSMLTDLGGSGLLDLQ
ncbi:hypothetical protein CASFOL_000023 [Castilleja foliolosa]|uniref:DNA-directed RNA polymerase n=1 Tax=Castilleja foliolosa TaxID=1961234 RepID=A0ABD3EPI0_9LAMI